nr:winged helix-turn-helix domain-containing protein [Planctomycetota bacterium]
AVALDRSVDAHIRSVRKKLGEARDLVETVRSMGYRFAEAAG